MKFNAGDVVRLSGKFLACTGQRAGGEGAKQWTVRECACSLCAGGQFVCTDEPADLKWYTAEEVAADPSLRWRHVAKGNLTKVGRPSLRDEAPYIGKLPLGGRT